MRLATTARRSRLEARYFDCVFLYACAALVQVLVLLSLFLQEITPIKALVYHGAVLGLVAGVLVLLAGQLKTHHYLALLLIAFGGPVGAAMATWFSKRFKGDHVAPPPELHAWYDTLAGHGLDFTARLSDDETAGDDDLTLLDPGALTLAEIVKDGSLAQRRNAIARIAAAYHPDYYPLFASALEDPEPTIRVQAAAILTGLGQEEREKLDACIDELPHASHERLLELSQAIAGHMTSRLLDAEGLRLAARAMGPIVSSVLAHGSSEDIARLRIQLVWSARGATGDQSGVLNALLSKLIDGQMLERAQ